MRSIPRQPPAQDAIRAVGFYKATRDGLDAGFVGPLWHFLGLAQMISTDIDRIARRRGLSSADLVLLGTMRVAAPDTLRPTDLAAKMHVSAAALSARIGRLESLGLIVRQRRTGDRRALELALTDAGVAVSDQATEDVAKEASFARRYGQLSEAEHASLGQILGKLHDLVDRDFLPTIRESG